MIFNLETIDFLDIILQEILLHIQFFIEHVHINWQLFVLLGIQPFVNVFQKVNITLTGMFTIVVLHKLVVQRILLHALHLALALVVVIHTLHLARVGGVRLGRALRLLVIVAVPLRLLALLCFVLVHAALALAA